MTKIKFLNFLLLFILIGCANSYKLEKKSILSFNESYYSPWSSGVKGGGSGYHVYLLIDENINLIDKNIKIEGVYFKGKFANLKLQELNKYQAFIRENSNSDMLEFENNLKNKTEETKTEKIPFVLKDNEAVISYVTKGKNKYVKIKLNKKQTKGFPM
ncbi:hypothetical protein SAMN05216503_2735 [Polaribacter sp. KT25b]|uniref:hypothetical protein n=1 Tax=Polaribacter sp. KT25b TaxID=1855336 RepID=UPI00087CAA7C|nr:hypothetical protein [Polaribacter sp. KT25b]SDS33749.1 hypothetical protein SAMN05216503_2735 [Polaribacter sp. KT25b]